MLFDLTLGLENIDGTPYKINRRNAVRAVILRENTLLLVKSNLGDYKFPGGGIENDESEADALAREVAEETGYIVSELKDKLGVIIERNVDSYENNALFEMCSSYYLCDVSVKQVSQKLDDYEEKMGFTPVWVKIEDALRNNESVMKSGACPSWVAREAGVLRILGK